MNRDSEETEKKRASDRKKETRLSREKQSARYYMELHMKMAMAKICHSNDIGTNRGYGVFIMVFARKMACLVGVCVCASSKFSLCIEQNHWEQNVFNHFT